MGIFRRKKKESRADYWDSGTVIGKHRFYRPLELLALPVKRYLQLHRALQEMQLKVVTGDLNGFVEGMRKAHKAGESSKMGWYIETLAAHNELFSSNKCMFNIANAAVLIDDEPFKQFSKKHSDIKRSLYNDDEEVQAFFLSVSNRYRSSILGLSPVSQEYLGSEVVRLTEEAFSRATGVPTLKGNS